VNSSLTFDEIDRLRRDGEYARACGGVWIRWQTVDLARYLLDYQHDGSDSTLRVILGEHSEDPNDDDPTRLYYNVDRPAYLRRSALLDALELAGIEANGQRSGQDQEEALQKALDYNVALMLIEGRK
jgi:hypothetical protein